MIVYGVFQPVHDAPPETLPLLEGRIQSRKGNAAPRTLCIISIHSRDGIAAFVTGKAGIGINQARQESRVQFLRLSAANKVDVVSGNVPSRMGPGDNRRIAIFLHYLQARYR